MLLDTGSFPRARGPLFQLESGPRSAELQFGTMGVVSQHAFSPNGSSALLFPAAFSDQNVRDAGCELQGRAGVSPAPVGFADGDSDLNTKTKPFLGVNDSQVQFHFSSLPSVTNTEGNEGNEEQPRWHLTGHPKVGGGDPLVSFLDRRGGSRGRARRAGETPALRCTWRGCAATKPDRGVSHSAARPLPQFATEDSRALSHVLPLRLGTSRAPGDRGVSHSAARGRPPIAFPQASGPGTHPQPLPGGERRLQRACIFPLLGGERPLQRACIVPLRGGVRGGSSGRLLRYRWQGIGMNQ